MDEVKAYLRQILSTKPMDGVSLDENVDMWLSTSLSVFGNMSAATYIEKNGSEYAIATFRRIFE